MSPLVALQDSVHAAWRARTPNSAAFSTRARGALAGGVSGIVRYFPPYPAYFERGDGVRVVDIDGNIYTDCFLSGACLMLGHRAPPIVEAIREGAERGSLILNPRHATETAERLMSIAPGAERVRFVNSGTEAVMSALRFARAFTGRAKIVKFLGTYHGMDDQMLVGLDGRAAVLGQGVTPGAVADVVALRFGDEVALSRALAGGDVAAVLMDPSMHHCGLWAGDGRFHHAARDMTRRAGALLIFDEVIAGFRIAAGGGQQHFGVTADLAVFGKALSAGEKLGAITGRADVMGVADPSGRDGGPFAFQSGTGNDSTVAHLCAQAAMAEYVKQDLNGGYDRIAGLATRLGQGLKAVFERRGMALCVRTLGPMVRIFLTGEAADFDSVHRRNRRQLNLFHLALLSEGVLTLPGSNDFFLSFAHTDADIDCVIGAADRTLDRFDFAAALDGAA